MNILICPDSFKGTLTAIEVSEIVGKVLSEKGIDIVLKPVADGGEGTIDVIEYSLGGKRNCCKVRNPLGKFIDAYYLTHCNTAYIEYAKSSGLILLNPDELNPFSATSYGFGELIKNAILKDYKNIILTLGGSATNDAGLGMLQVLGVKFFDIENSNLCENENVILNASNLKCIYDFDDSDLQKLSKGVKFEILTDVKNPLTGIDGATYVYAKQKGANVKDIEKLEEGIIHFAKIISSKFNKDMNFPGAGAAGGVSGAAAIFLKAKISSGISELINILNLENFIKNSDIVVTGEGAMDFQTAFGKAPFGIAQMAKKYRKIVIGITGKTGNRAEELLSKGFDCILSSYGNIDIDINVVKKNSKDNLKKISEKLANIIENQNIPNKIIVLNK